MRKLLLSLMILIGTLTAKAANFGYLTFEMTGGEKVSVPIESLKMTISGTTLIAGTKTFVIANLVKMYFSTSDESTTDVDRIDSTTLDEAEEIYDLKGQRVTRTQMRKGVYIIGTKNKTYKIVVK